MSHDPDHELVVRVGRGETPAFRILVGRHLTKGVRMAERMLGNRQDAEDVMQEACLKIWHEAPKWQPNAKFSTWLYRVIFNGCIDRKRKVIPFAVTELETIMDDSKPVDEVMIESQRGAQVKRALQELPERQRMALVLSYYEEQSNQEAADIMQMSLGAYQQLLFRGKQQLKTLLHKELKEVGYGKRARS